jgi:MarR family transcriptional regulator, lower aerobic nicotinate degradation pathway regulator
MVDDIPHLLRLAHRRAATSSAAALRPFGMDDRHLGVLRALGRLGPSSQRRLVDALGTDKSSMVRTVDDLERLGLVWRAPATGDRRAYAVELTPAGRDLLDDAERTAAAAGAELLACLSPAEQETLGALLRRFVDAGRPATIEDGDPDAGPDRGPDPVPGYAPPHRTRRARAAALLTQPDEDADPMIASSRQNPQRH